MSKDAAVSLNSLPDDNVPEKLLIRRTVASEGVELTAARMKGIFYSRMILRDQKNCHSILTAMASMPDSTIRRSSSLANLFHSCFISIFFLVGPAPGLGPDKKMSYYS